MDGFLCDHVAAVQVANEPIICMGWSRNELSLVGAPCPYVILQSAFRRCDSATATGYLSAPSADNLPEEPLNKTYLHTVSEQPETLLHGAHLILGCVLLLLAL